MISVFTGLRKVLLGLKYQLQVDLNIDETKRACLVLRDRLKSHHAHTNINYLLGILNSYTIENVNSLVQVSDLSEDRVREFEKLLDDELFRQLSENGYYLGIPGKLKRAIYDIKKIATKILARRTKPLLKLAATPVNIATGGWADVSAVADLLPENKPNFLPPIAWFSGAHAIARERFDAQETPTEPDEKGDFVILPQKPIDKDILIEQARKILGARLKTHYSDDDQDKNPKTK